MKYKRIVKRYLMGDDVLHVKQATCPAVRIMAYAGWLSARKRAVE